MHGDVLPTFAVYGTARIDEAGVEGEKRALEQRMVRLFVDDPIPSDGRMVSGFHLSLPNCRCQGTADVNGNP
jgi:hypothetical protein